MNNPYLRITISLFITAAIFSIATYMTNLRKRDIAPAFRLIAHEYKAESEIADQMRKLRDYKQTPSAYEEEYFGGYKIDFQPAKKNGKWFYRLILTNPDEQRLLQIIATPDAPDIFSFE